MQCNAFMKSYQQTMRLCYPSMPHGHDCQTIPERSSAHGERRSKRAFLAPRGCHATLPSHTHTVRCPIMPPIRVSPGCGVRVPLPRSQLSLTHLSDFRASASPKTSFKLFLQTKKLVISHLYPSITVAPVTRSWSQCNPTDHLAPDRHAVHKQIPVHRHPARKYNGDDSHRRAISDHP